MAVSCWRPKNKPALRAERRKPWVGAFQGDRHASGLQLVGTLLICGRASDLWQAVYRAAIDTHRAGLLREDGQLHHRAQLGL